jgi:hypothetical protein
MNLKLIDTIRILDFPFHAYVVVGSGILAIRGIRPARDIDIVVTGELYNECKKSGWREEWHAVVNKYALHKHVGCFEVELYRDVNGGEVQFTFEELRASADIFQNAPFISLPQMLRVKQRCASWGAKHREDVAYLQRLIFLEN